MTSTPYIGVGSVGMKYWDDLLKVSKICTIKRCDKKCETLQCDRKSIVKEDVIFKE